MTVIGCKSMSAMVECASTVTAITAPEFTFAYPHPSLWYLKEKGWIRRLEDGLLAITVDGVDRTHSERHRGANSRLLTDQTLAS